MIQQQLLYGYVFLHGGDMMHRLTIEQVQKTELHVALQRSNLACCFMIHCPSDAQRRTYLYQDGIHDPVVGKKMSLRPLLAMWSSVINPVWAHLLSSKISTVFHPSGAQRLLDVQFLADKSSAVLLSYRPSGDSLPL
jgi:hypothetical protein